MDGWMVYKAPVSLSHPTPIRSNPIGFNNTNIITQIMK